MIKQHLYKLLRMVLSVLLLLMLCTSQGYAAMDKKEGTPFKILVLASPTAQYDVYEMSCTFPPEVTFAHPFTDVAAAVTFTDPHGKKRTVDGFFSGDNEWKVRFAPDVVGTWACQLTMRLPQETIVHDLPPLTCIPGKLPGFVRRNPKNPFTWIFDNGQPYWPIGLQDCIGAGPGGDPFKEWAIDGGDRVGPWKAGGISADQYLDAYARAGFNLFRFSPDNCSYSHYDTLDNYKLVEMAWTDELMQELRARGYRIFYGFIGYANAFIKEPDDAAKMEKVKRYLHYSVARWGAYVDIWELLNEQEADPKWSTMMAEYVRSIDPYHHPITDWKAETLPAIDINSPHWYEREPEEASDAITASHAEEWKKLGKPVIVGEQGNDENVWDYGSARRLRYRIWSALFNEISFVFWNTSYARNGHYMNIYLGPEERQYINALQNFTTYLDAGMKQVLVEDSSPEIRAYGLASEARLAVYLHNRWGRKVGGETITVTVPKAGYGYWFAPDTLRLLGMFHMQAGAQQIVLPNFSRDLTLLINPTPITNGPPLAIIDVNPQFGFGPQEVTFDGRRSIAAFDHKIVDYEWRFSDGGKANGSVVKHTFPAGNYFTTLTATDDAGVAAAASLAVRVADSMAVTRPPLVTATADKTTGTAPLTVHFIGKAEMITGKITRVSWQFGDGATSEQLEVTHVYEKPGTYTAVLSVSTDQDSGGSVEFVITIR